MDHLCYLCFVCCHAFASVNCCLVVTCWKTADPLALVCDVSLCVFHFPMWYPGSGVVSIPDLYCFSYFVCTLPS